MANDADHGQQRQHAQDPWASSNCGRAQFRWSSSSCGGALLAARCDGRGDATAALQAALVACAEQREALTLPAGRTCLSLPLSLPSNTRLELPAGTALKAAGPVGRWPNCSWTASPFDSPVNYCRPNSTGGAPQR